MKAIIIGGGIIGMSTAFYMLAEGYEVTIIDSTNIDNNCSFGNMGMIVPSHFVPLAAPGIVSQGLKWMLNSRSPFYVKPSLNGQLIKWGLQFIKHANAQNVQQAALPLRDINLLSKVLYTEMVEVLKEDVGLRKDGIIMYYQTPAVEHEEARLASQAANMGLDVDILTKQQVQALEPNAQANVLGGVHYKCDAHLTPNKLMARLKGYLQQRGVHFLTESEVTGIQTKQHSIQSVRTKKGEHTADIYVLAAGSWSPQLAKMAGVKVPLMPGKGYSVTLQQPTATLNIPAILCEARVALTPMQAQLRYGGTMELTTINQQVNMRRVEGIVNSIQRYFPGLGITMPKQEEVWFGYRPCSPDGLPLIGYAKGCNNLVVAAGHAMMGLSLGPATGKLITELITGKQTSIATTAFDPNRF
ncbi:D-amino-acid dehydrogenase [Chitinophaga skermanii]|uniref:D-amino-acid dehydrogenase n=1 Tax=Chitinophaga skermanii TaxID=331697 RepID=A0A327QV37_9BACT|nr:FAD-dependent oxidoreductase [Chitinophaga skermanii]RAJ08479.1 D-amino-acid dehydrogenase [Chitinophaga skermanii]